ncbi:MAG: hypothetical protein R2710_14565 [Acidimicrobiales bacterium]
MADSVVRNNLVGVAADGVTPLPNLGTGIDITWSQRTIVRDNVVLASPETDLARQCRRCRGRGNRIGTDSSATVAGTIGGAGVVVGSGTDRALIGGTNPLDANVVANATGDGVVMTGGSDATLLGNEIWGNGGLGIDLGDDGVTQNDAGDVDTGVNDLLNQPALSRAVVSAGTVTLDLNLDVPAGNYRIEVFDNPTGTDPTRYGEAETLVHAFTVAHSGSGIEAFSTTFSGSSGMQLSATATEDLGGSYGATSELSQVETVEAADTIVVNSSGDGVDINLGDGRCDTGDTNADGAVACSLRAAIAEANASAAIDVVHFDIPILDAGYVAGAVDHWQIAPASELPNLWAERSVLDATTQLGGDAAPVVLLTARASRGVRSVFASIPTPTTPRSGGSRLCRSRATACSSVSIAP